MPPDPTAARSEDRCRHCRTRAVSVQPNSQCGRAVRVPRRRSTNLSPMHTIHHRASVRPYGPTWTLALQISLLHTDVERS
jgi:hypothetical protein